MSNDDVYFDITFDGDVAIVKMCRGENRINDKFLERFLSALDFVLKRPGIKALITTGTGRFYNNGVDVDWVRRLDDEQMVRLHDMLSVLFARILTFPLPTVAAINGHAFGAGAILALVHDHLIMQTKRGWWCLNEVLINIRMRSDVIALTKSRLCKSRSLEEALVLGRRFTAEDALTAGIVQEICAPDDLMLRALTWIRNNLPESGYNRNHLQMHKQDVYRDVFDVLMGKGGGSKL